MSTEILLIISCLLVIYFIKDIFVALIIIAILWSILTFVINDTIM